jgi:ferric-dicitrate binding protein FerR (iron transport regulator)
MDEKKINIVIKFLSGEASGEEKSQVENWKKLFPEEFNEIDAIYNSNLFDVKHFNAEKVKEDIFGAIKSKSTREISNPVININRAWMKIAATLLILITIGAGIVLYNNITAVHLLSNNSGNLKKVILPDGSTITLDKYSSLSYKTDWLNRFIRNVDLEGRAYFVISKDPAHPFRVNASDVTVTVLGTRFTVSEISDRIQVVLNEGKVRVSTEESDRSYILSHSGDQLIISNGNFVKQNVVNKNLYFSWLNEKLHFKNCTVGEAVEFLSDSYNLKININDSKVLKKQLFGSAPSDDPKLILKAIAYITNKNIKDENGMINLK